MFAHAYRIKTDAKHVIFISAVGNILQTLKTLQSSLQNAPTTECSSAVISIKHVHPKKNMHSKSMAILNSHFIVVRFQVCPLIGRDKMHRSKVLPLPLIQVEKHRHAKQERLGEKLLT